MYVLKKYKKYIRFKVLIILRNFKYSWKYVIIWGEHKILRKYHTLSYETKFLKILSYV